MKKLFVVLGCVTVLTVAGVIAKSNGLFKAPASTKAEQYLTSVTSWAKGGFRGSPLASVPTPEQEVAAKAKTTELAHLKLARLVAESKQRALAKHPDLAVVNTEMNSRFVFRYNYLVKDNSPRLQDPTWPESLADECAAAQKRTKPNQEKNGPIKSIIASPKKLVASSVP